jgi:mono/diheme cytochrome c family protein
MFRVIFRPRPLIGAAAALVLAGCAPDTPPENAAANGEALFSQRCGACHGAEGRGPSLEELRALSPEELRARIRNHPRAGDVLDRLPAVEFSDLVEFIEE